MNCLWRPCLLMDRDEMSNLYRGPSIDASYQVSVHLAEGFQRRKLKCEKLTDDRRQKTDAKWRQKLTSPLARWAKNDCHNKCSLIFHSFKKSVIPLHSLFLLSNLKPTYYIQPYFKWIFYFFTIYGHLHTEII